MGNKANNRAKQKEARKKPHNHFPDGKTGYVPRGVGITDMRILRKKMEILKSKDTNKDIVNNTFLLRFIKENQE